MSELKNLEGKELNNTIILGNKDDVVLMGQVRQFPLTEAEYLKITQIRSAFDYFAWGLIVSIIPVGLQIISQYPDIDKWMIKFIFWAAIISIFLFLISLKKPQNKKKVMGKIDRYFEAAEKKNE